jgi:glycosyltransferase involved in cell wall biosynthesis
LQPIFPEVGRGSEWSGRERLFAREIGQATLVIVGTEAGRSEVERFYGVPSSRIRILPHPTPSFPTRQDEGVDAKVLERYGIRPGFVFYPAQYWAHKNHWALIEALRRLDTEHGLTLQAVFVGSDRGNEGHVRSIEERAGLAGRVHHLGFVPRDHLASLYRQAFALAYLSYFGPENLPPLEAFALGCPVVASAVSGSEEQLGDAALLVPPTDVDGVARALLSLHRDPNLRTLLIERGRKRAAQYSPDHYADDMLNTLDELEPVIRTWR